MIQWTGAVERPRPDLGVAVKEFLYGQDQFICTKILPPYPVDSKEGTLTKITRASLLRRVEVKRAPRSVFSRDGYDAKGLTYKCTERGHEVPVDVGEAASFPSFDAEQVGAMAAERRVLQEQEIDVAAMFSDGTFAGAALQTTVGTAWSNVASDIIGDIQGAKEKVIANTGMEANALVMSRTVLTYMLKNTGIKDAIKYVQAQTIDALQAALPALFGLPKILVGKGVYNSADENQAFVGAGIWGTDHVMVARIAETQDQSEPCLGRTLIFRPDAPDADGIVIEEYYEPQTRSMIERCRQHVVEKFFDEYFCHVLDITP